MPIPLEQFGLSFNPFEPAASGAPPDGKIEFPTSWREKLVQLIVPLSQGKGVKAIAITGEYGSGKTYVLKWLSNYKLSGRPSRSFYFDNPGVHFYDLANSLLRQIGRKDFAKRVWELAEPYVDSYQRGLFSRGFEAYLSNYHVKHRAQTILNSLQDAIQTAEITLDEEIAHRIARIVAETPKKPYFDYRDFVTGKQGSLVAEGEEAPYFRSVLKVLRLAEGDSIGTVVFLIDEFEEISLQKRLTRREAHDYLATLKRLINITQSEDLWIFVAMTPQAAEETQALEPSLWERFTGHGKYEFRIQPLQEKEAIGLIKSRLDVARLADFNPPNELFPFPDELGTALSPLTISTPRRLVKVGFHAISRFAEDEKALPFGDQYLQRIESEIYPTPNGGD